LLAALSLSELMTLAVLFHSLRYRQFKSFYLSCATRFLQAEFPGLPSSHHSMELLPLCAAGRTVPPSVNGTIPGVAW
jgi:hypothetical protein